MSFFKREAEFSQLHPDGVVADGQGGGDFFERGVRLLLDVG